MRRPNYNPLFLRAEAGDVHAMQAFHQPQNIYAFACTEDGKEFKTYGKNENTLLGHLISSIHSLSDYTTFNIEASKPLQLVLNQFPELVEITNKQNQSPFDLLALNNNIAECNKFILSIELLAAGFKYFNKLRRDGISIQYDEHQVKCVQSLVYNNDKLYRKYGDTSNTALHEVILYLNKASSLEGECSSAVKNFIMPFLIHCPKLVHEKNNDNLTPLALFYTLSSTVNNVSLYKINLAFFGAGARFSDTLNYATVNLAFFDADARFSDTLNYATASDFLHDSLVDERNELRYYRFMNYITLIHSTVYSDYEQMRRHGKNTTSSVGYAYPLFTKTAFPATVFLRELEIMLEEVFSSEAKKHSASFSAFVSQEQANFIHCAIRMIGLHFTETQAIKNIKFFVSKDVDINKQDILGNTPLMDAIIKKHSVILIKFLIELGANPNIATVDEEGGKYPIHCAVKYGILEVIKELKEGGANLDVQDAKGCTPLHCAIMSDDICHKTIALLIELGANPNIKDDEQKTPMYYAEECSDQEVISTLESATSYISDDEMELSSEEEALSYSYEGASVLIYTNRNLESLKETKNQQLTANYAPYTYTRWVESNPANGDTRPCVCFGNTIEFVNAALPQAQQSAHYSF